MLHDRFPLRLICLLFVALVLLITRCRGEHAEHSRLRRQLKKFAYADPCELKCATEQLAKKLSIRETAVSPSRRDDRSGVGFLPLGDLQARLCGQISVQASDFLLETFDSPFTDRFASLFAFCRREKIS